jgi:hypothetical protein
MKISIGLLLCLLFMVSSSFAAEFTVDDDGGYDYVSLADCVNHASGGDTCTVYDGTYAGFTWSSSGSPGAWITVIAADGHSPVVDGGIGFDDVDYLRIEGLTLKSLSTASYTGPKCNHLKILNNSFSGAGNSGIAISLRGDDILISGNTFDDFGNDIVRQFGQRWTIRNNTVIDETEFAPQHMDFWQTFCGGAAPDELVGSFGLIENNVWIDVSGGNTHFVLGNATSSCGIPITNMIIRHNIAARSGTAFVVLDTNAQSPGTSKNVVYNNSFCNLYPDGTIPTWLDYITMTGSTDSSGINNLFYRAMDYGRTRGFLWASGGRQAYNLYYDPDHTMTFTSPAAAETGAVKNKDPLLADPDRNDFSLDPDSPARDTGGPLTAVAASDSGAGTSLVVEKAEFFQPGWGGVEADWIAVGSLDNVAQIVSIDYDADTIILAGSLARSDGDPVYLYKDSDGTPVLNGAAPDIGAIEYGTDGVRDNSGGGGNDAGSSDGTADNGGSGCFVRMLLR